MMGTGHKKVRSEENIHVGGMGGDQVRRYECSRITSSTVEL